MQAPTVSIAEYRAVQAFLAGGRGNPHAHQVPPAKRHLAHRLNRSLRVRLFGARNNVKR